MSDINQNIMILRSLVEESVDHRLNTSTDFAYLAGCIQGRLKQTISVSTLERIWGYVKGYQTVRESTLSILAQFIGYSDWSTFVRDYCDVPSAQSSHRVTMPMLTYNEVPVGGEVIIEWNPNRHCKLRHDGQGYWTVVESLRSKLSSGDKFLCYRFTLHQPLYLDEFRHKEEEPCIFVVGNRGGLTKADRVE